MRRSAEIACAFILALAVTASSAGATGLYALAALLLDHGHHHVASVAHDGGLTLRHAADGRGEPALSEAHADHALGSGAPAVLRANDRGTSLAAASLIVLSATLPFAGAAVEPPVQAIDPPAGPPLYLQKRSLLI